MNAFFGLKQTFVVIIAHILQKEKRKNPVIPMTRFYKNDLAKLSIAR